MLDIKNVSKMYGEKKALNDVSLHVPVGSIFGIIGHNGAGKTTLIRLITGLLAIGEKSAQGEITVAGHSVKDEPMECKKIMAYIPDNPDLYENLTGLQYLNFVADVYEVSEEDRQSRIKKYADMFEIYDDLQSQIASYSHGMKQKVAIIGAIIHEPKLLILDEPFVGLDPKAAFVLKSIMHEMCESGTAIFFSTHVLDVAEKLCDRIAIIKKGCLVASGTMDELIGDQSLEDVFMEVANAEQ